MAAKKVEAPSRLPPVSVAPPHAAACEDEPPTPPPQPLSREAVLLALQEEEEERETISLEGLQPVPRCVRPEAEAAGSPASSSSSRAVKRSGRVKANFEDFLKQIPATGAAKVTAKVVMGGSVPKALGAEAVDAREKWLRPTPSASRAQFPADERL